jgi:signal transduction histidine kinase
MVVIFKKLRLLLHPIFLFVVAQVSWALLMYVWIRWYVSRNAEFEDLLKRLGVNHDLETGQWIILLEGCVLMGILLVALYSVFVSFRRQVRLNKLQDSILSSVTHELKTPLASIRLYSETMLMYELTQEERNRFLSNSLRELERLQALVDRILLSAKLYGSSRRSNLEYVDLLDIAKLSWKKLNERMGQERVLTLSGFPKGDELDEPVTIKGVRYELVILFDNLLDNAMKYTNSGGHIQFKLELTEDRVEFCVEDDGIGIQNDQLKRIFRRFYRAQDASRRYVKGSGLGLSVAMAIAKAHHGNIVAKSKGIGKGASFHVNFKRSDFAR